MDLQKKIEFLSEQLTMSIGSFGGKRARDKSKATVLKLSITALGGATTVLLGIQGVSPELLFRNAALVLSALVSILSAFDTFFNHRALWVRYTQTHNELRGIQRDLEYALAGGSDSVSVELIDKLYQRYSQCLRETNKWWLQTRQEQSTPSNC